jgi:hypothetical protein
MHILITVKSIASELIRTQGMRKAHTIKENKQTERTYPLPNRRLKGSDLI